MAKPKTQTTKTPRAKKPAAPPAERVPHVGETVLYAYPIGHPRVGAIRPAVVVRVWGPGLTNLQVFCDGTNDTFEGSPTLWVTSAARDDRPLTDDESGGQKGEPNTWRFLPG